MSVKEKITIPSPDNCAFHVFLYFFPKQLAGCVNKTAKIFVNCFLEVSINYGGEWQENKERRIYKWDIVLTVAKIVALVNWLSYLCPASVIYFFFRCILCYPFLMI